MNAGLLTFYHTHHYGTFLQAYAMQQAVEALGVQCTLLDYDVSKSNTLLPKPHSLGSAIANVRSTTHYKALKQRYIRFEKAKATYLRKTSTTFRSNQELVARCPEVDVLLSGSNQIWNAKLSPSGQFDPVFFGSFSQKRKISYAPSFGSSQLPPSLSAELAGHLRHFSHISVRERQGASIVKEATGQDVPVVLDPTLLLSKAQWGALAIPPKETGGYILCYCIHMESAMVSYVRQLSKRTGLPIVQLCGVRQKIHPKVTRVMDAGPEEFLGLFQNASYVCTNSFHGTVFSTLFEKPFFSSVSLAEIHSPHCSRTFNLLSTLGLTQRIIGTGDTAGLLEPIDYQQVNVALHQARTHSLTYLGAALDNKPFVSPLNTAQKPSPKLAAHDACTGCTACATTCPTRVIEMTPDGEGFSYPHVNIEGCVSCGNCTQVCPALKPAPIPNTPVVYGAWNLDEQVRKHSTSGGIFSLLAQDTIAQGGVVFGAAFDGKLHLRHVAAFTKEQCTQFRGAKYVQSDLSNVYPQIKAWLKTRPVLFSGTPCQVDGLYQYLGCRPETLTTCDFLCHGVPSPAVWSDTVAYWAQKAKSPVVHVTFREKVTGWQKSHLTVHYENGCMNSAPFWETPYGNAMKQGITLRPSCHTCPYTSATRPSDLTLGDFGDLGKGDLADQQEKGLTLLMVNTAHGSYVFDQLPMGKQKCCLEQVKAGNPALVSPAPSSPQRASFFATYAVEPFETVYKRFWKPPSMAARIAKRSAHKRSRP